MDHSQNKSCYDDNHKYKSKQIRNNLTCHLEDPMSRAYIELFMQIEGYNTLSEWLKHVIEKEVIPARISKISEILKESKK